MKKLSRIAVQRPVTFVMITLIVIGFGVFGLSRLSLNLYPDVSFPTISVYTTYEGVAPGDMETLVTRPIEELVGSVGGLQRVRSLSSQGASVIKLYFNWGTDLFVAQADVRKQIDFARRSIPQDADSPIVFTYDPNQEPVIVLTLTSATRSPVELRTIATEQIEQRFERIEGIASAETAGGLERQINIWVDNASMLSYNIDIGTLSNRLRQENIQVPAGELIEGRSVYSLRTIGEFQDIDQIRNTIVGINNGVPVRLIDVADVEDGVAQPIGNVHIRGEEGVIINLYRQSDVNVVTTADNVINNLDRIRSTLPSDMRLEILANEADFIKLSINNLYITGLMAITLVVLILLFFLRSARSSLIIAISIPVSIISTFSIMDFADVTLNVISLSGLTLAVGLVVDNAVVVLENIYRFREEGHGNKKAAVMGAQEVGVPVVVSTLTTLVVFLPILFVPGIAGFLFRDLALTISFALVISTLVALSLIPLMSSQIFGTKGGGPSKPRKNGFFDRLDKKYTAVVRSLLDRSGLVVAAAVLFMIVTTPFFFRLGGEFFPAVDESSFTLEVTREAGVNLFELQRSIRMAEEIVTGAVPEARLIVSDYGDKRGVEGADNPGGYRGLIRVELVSTTNRDRSQFEIVADLLDRLEDLPGADVREFKLNPLNPDGQEGLIVNIYGFDLETKRDLAQGVKDELLQIPGVLTATSSAEEGRPELRVVMDRERISRVGLSTSQVANAISNAVRGNLATTFVDRGVEFDVRVQLAAEERSSSQALEDVLIQTPAGDWMPLRNLARVERVTGPSNILRINQDRVTEVEADLAGIDLRTASDLARERLDRVEWPDGYRYEIGGTAEEQQASFFYLMIAFMIAAILAYMVMASQFESLVEPFIIILTIPLAFSGVIVMLYLTNTPVSVTSMVGLILLSGIVVNNGIVMIDYIKILQSRGLDRIEAIATGAGRRLRPILITAATTILCMVPLALEIGSGSETWSPMARTVIGGLTMSTLLMLLVVPCLYKLVNTMIEKMGFDSIHKTDPLNELNEIPEA
ncbi:MAG: efflux RND transporter permease subunit [Rhodothermaceae bacterium]|nr:efflux RND transporter permease subunit [Rhodothermaceae bacterium]